MYPADIEEVKRLCQRIVEEQDPQTFSSLVEELNTLLKDDGEQNHQIPKGTPPDTKNTVWHPQAELCNLRRRSVYEFRATHPRALRQGRSGF